MSFESIIGFIASLITIFLAVKGAIIVARKWFLKPPMSTLFTQLLNQELTDKERRVILKKLNGYDLINNRIKEQYIQHFALDNRKQEALLLDICDSNDIEPTIEICKNLIGNKHLLQILRQLILAKPASSLWKVECKLYICQNC